MPAAKKEHGAAGALAVQAVASRILLVRCIRVMIDAFVQLRDLLAGNKELARRLKDDGAVGSVGQPHDERKGDIKSRDVSVVEMPHPLSDALAPDRDGLVGHDLRSHPQTIDLARFDRHPEVRCLGELGRHLAYDE